MSVWSESELKAGESGRTLDPREELDCGVAGGSDGLGSSHGSSSSDESLVSIIT